MIKVRIGTSERLIDDADPNWINEQINRRRMAGEGLCVRVVVDRPPLNVVLATPGCANVSGASSRPPNVDEQRLYELWDQLGLNDGNFPGGKLVAFLARLK